MKVAQLRKLIESSWYGDAGPYSLLLPFAWLYGCIVRVRRFLFDAGIFSKPELPVPVIVVGNITVGGTGKTPVVAWLAQQLLSRGYRPGIVSRGYGGAVHRVPVLVQSDDAGQFGDEPVLLAHQTGCPVCVCVDRVSAVRRLAQEGSDVVIADDGLQHYRMRRVVEIVVVDGDRGFGNGKLLPAGSLRESAATALQADAIVVNGSVDRVAGFQVQLQPGNLLSVNGGSERTVASFCDQRVWAVAGIGNPQRFFRILRAAGIHIDEVDVPDHGVTDLASLRASRRQPVLMTEKDAVKYRRQQCDDAWYLPVRAMFAPEAETSLMSIVTDALGSPA